MHPVSVTKYAKAGKLPAVITPGGCRRFRYEDVVVFAKTMNIDLPTEYAANN